MIHAQRLTCPACGAPLPDDFEPQRPFRCRACGSTLVLADLDFPDRVRCTACQAFNADINRFCERCGATLHEFCPLCYAENPPGSEFCRRCGANLTRARQDKEIWLASERAHLVALKAAWQDKQNDTPAQVQRLVDDLDEPQNHSWAVYCLHQIGGEAVDTLIETLRDPDPDARYGAAKALGLIGEHRAIPGLIASLADAEPAVRYWSADALGKLQAEEAVDVLAIMLRDEHAGVREQAATALKQIGTPAALERLRPRRWWPF